MPVRHVLSGLTLAAGVCALAAPLRAQTVDARLIGLGGLHLGRSASLTRYNAAYRAVPERKEQGLGGKVTIPIPLGLIKFFHDHPINKLSKDPLFHPDSTRFNPIETLNLILNPPLFYEVRAAPTPTNDVIFTIAKDTLIVDLGKAQVLIPQDEFGLGGSGRPFGMGFGIHGVHVGVSGFVQDKVGFTLNDSLRAFLANAHPAATLTSYDILVDGQVQGGFAPEVGFAERIWGTEDRGLYLGATVHYYQGVGYTSARGPAGFTTADTIFKGNNPVRPNLDLTIAYSKFGNSFGHGVGGDFGVVWVAGPFEVGAGINDIGTKLTWSDTRVERWIWDTTGVKDSLKKTLVADHVESHTRLPVSYVANLAYTLPGGTIVGADVLDRGRGTVIHLGAEQRMGPLALRGGISRDERKKVQFGFGGGLRLGPLGLDVGLWTNSHSFSNVRGITMATSLTLY